MGSEPVTDYVKDLWQELSMDPVPFTPEQVRREEEKLRSRVRRRSLVGRGIGWLVVAAFTLYLFVFPNLLQRIGSLLSIAGVVYCLIQLRLQRPRPMPDAGETESIRFYRAELERLRDFHRGGWLWSRVIVLLPGPIIFMAGFARAYPNLGLGTFVWVNALVVFVGAVAVGVPLNLKLARQYQRRIDALDAWQRG